MQPPSGGCVLKLADVVGLGDLAKQPPSGGCVLKLWWLRHDGGRLWAAAFGRLCVETPSTSE